VQGEWLNRVTLQPRGMAVVYWFMAIDLTLRLFLYYRLSVKPNVKNPVEKQCRKEKVPDSLPIGRSIFQEEGYLPPHLLPATLNHPVFNQVWHISHKIGAAIPGLPVTTTPDFTIKYYRHTSFQKIEPLSKKCVRIYTKIILPTRLFSTFFNIFSVRFVT